MFKIVLIDDEKDWLDILHTLLTSMDLEVEVKQFSSVQEAYNYLLTGKQVDLVISDYLFPNEMTGLELFDKITGIDTKNFILISNSRIPPEKIKEIVHRDIVYLPKSYLVVKNFFKKHLLESLQAIV